MLNRFRAMICTVLPVFLAALIVFFGVPAEAGSGLDRFLDKLIPTEIYPGATRFGTAQGSPPAAPIYEGDALVGYVWLNSDVVSSIGYSGKPIHIVVGMDLNGTFTGIKMVEHFEPIVLIGIPESVINRFNEAYVGTNVLELLDPARRDKPPADIISGATVTVLVIHDTITRSAIKVLRSRNLAGFSKDDRAQREQPRAVNMAQDERKSWKSLLGDGSVRRLNLSIGDINEHFIEFGPKAAAERAEKGKPDETFIDMYAALVSAPTIGRSLLGDAEYKLMKARLKPDQQGVLIAANGRYSFKGSGYVRGGIFDRIHVVQGEDSIRFRDRDHKRLGDVEAAGAPRFAEVALYIVPDGLILRPDKGWRVELLVARATGAIKKAFTNFSLDYLLPAKYLEPKIAPVALKTPLTLENGNTSLVLWQRIWKDRIVDVVILSLAILLLTGIFFFQGVLVRYPVLMKRIRTGFLLFTLFWIGGYAHAQLSVVNIMTIFNSVTSGFNWEFFLMDPLLFILWCSVAASVLFWGRGAYCGWLCPFGAMQELLNMLAKRVGVPQYTVPWGLHERLWPIKYMIFLPLFGLSVYSFALAETFAEIEPFKTAIVLKFAREWPFVLYALTLLAAGLFVERFFCRYLCPLGAGLAIPARLRMFEWLYRHHDCGSSCHRCAQECMVQAIHPDGKINPNECHYCLHCLEVYSDDQRCPPMIKKRQRRERRAALSGDTKTPEK